MKRTLLSAILALLLAAGILAAGTMVPGRLLQQRRMEFAREAAVVPISDVRPYGDDYETMKQSLLQTIGLFQRLGDPSEENVVEQSWDGDAEAVNEQTQLFLKRWGDGIRETGYILYALYSDYWYGVSFGAAADAADPENWIIGGGVSSWEGPMELDYIASPWQGVPISLNLYLTAYAYKLSPQLLWDSLTAAYQAQCGLTFTEATVTSGDVVDAAGYAGLEEQEDWFMVQVSQLQSADCVYSAVSADFAFRLEMTVVVSERDSGGLDWLVSAALTENK